MNSTTTATGTTTSTTITSTTARTTTTPTIIIKQNPKRYAVKKLIRNTNGKKWDTVALYDQNNNFRGEALFESKEEAQKYIESYKKRMNDRILDRYGRHKSSVSLKVFTVDEDGKEKEIIIK